MPQTEKLVFQLPYHLFSGANLLLVFSGRVWCPKTLQHISKGFPLIPSHDSTPSFGYENAGFCKVAAKRENVPTSNWKSFSDWDQNSFCSLRIMQSQKLGGLELPRWSLHIYTVTEPEPRFASRFGGSSAIDSASAAYKHPTSPFTALYLGVYGKLVGLLSLCPVWDLRSRCFFHCKWWIGVPLWWLKDMGLEYFFDLSMLIWCVLRAQMMWEFPKMTLPNTFF